MSWNDIIEKIKSSENINKLPLLNELADYDERHDDIFVNDGELITIKDGTEIQIAYCPYNCFNDKKSLDGHWYFYYIPCIDTYICMECGQWQKDYDINYMLPYEWNKNGVKSYLKKNESINEEKKNHKKQIVIGNCSDCIHMKNCECEYGNEEYSQNECDDYEGR